MHEGPVVVVSGGGTGGHLYPALAIADALRSRRPDVHAFFIGARRGLEARLLPERGEEHLLLTLHGIDRGRPWTAIRAFAELTIGVFQTMDLYRRLRPEAVVVTGGYAAAPAGLAAAFMRIPLVVQEQNSFPGKVSTALSRWATQIHVAYPEAIERLRGVEPRVSGNPVRDHGAGDADARAVFGLPEHAPIVLVAGGSQGSIALNRVMVELAAALSRGEVRTESGAHFLWATGRRHFDGIRTRMETAGAAASVHAVPYFDDMPSALAVADVAVSRSGAMSVAELLNHGLPAVLVPLPTSAEDHQMHNARAVEAAGAAIVVPEPELTARLLADRVDELLRDADSVEQMSAAANRLAKPDARHEIAAGILEILEATR